MRKELRENPLFNEYYNCYSGTFDLFDDFLPNYLHNKNQSNQADSEDVRDIFKHYSLDVNYWETIIAILGDIYYKYNEVKNDIDLHSNNYTLDYNSLAELIQSIDSDNIKSIDRVIIKTTTNNNIPLDIDLVSNFWKEVILNLLIEEFPDLNKTKDEPVTKMGPREKLEFHHVAIRGKVLIDLLMKFDLFEQRQKAEKFFIELLMVLNIINPDSKQPFKAFRNYLKKYKELKWENK